MVHASLNTLIIEMFSPAANVRVKPLERHQFPPESTTAMTPLGALTFDASAFPAAMTRSAPSNVRDFFSNVCAAAVDPTARSSPNIKMQQSNFFRVFIVLPYSLKRVVQPRWKRGDPVVWLGLNYITGELNFASPRLTSANAHQITTLDTFLM